MALSYDSPETLAAFAARHGITYTLLSDTSSAVIRAWGLLNEVATGREAGIPHPGTLILDRDRRVVERAFEQNYQERSTGASLLARLGAVVAPREPATVTGAQVSVRTGVSDGTAAPGERVTLIVDVTPAPRMHVYAPGQAGYIPVSLALEAGEAYRAHAPRFPPSGTYYFEPLQETVRVYDKPFRITQEITLALTPDLRRRAAARETLTLRGRLDYQACDDLVCYKPATLPLTWTIALTPVIR